MKKKTLTILLACTLIFIWGNSLVPGDASAWISDTLMEYMNRAAARVGLRDDVFTYMYDQDGDGVEEPTSHIVRKIAHVTEFAVFAALLWLRLESRGAKRALTAFLGGAATGAVDETLQIFSHRGSSVTDVFIDSGGVLLGLSLAILFSHCHRRRKQPDTGP